MLVSVLINSFNYGKYLDYCIESVLAQTYRDIEIILYDDGSTDDSVSAARKYEDRITIIAEDNYGHGQCFNQANAIHRAFQVAKGEIICLLDVDDAFYPEKIERVVEEFKRDESVVLVQHKFQDINEQNQPIWIPRKEILQIADCLQAIYFTQRLDYFFMPNSALSFRRSYLEEVLPVPVDQYDKVVIDIRLTRMAIFWGRVKTIDRELSQYRVHAQSYTGRTMSREYLADLFPQMYDYFNTKAKEHGYPPLPYKPGVYWKMLLYLRLLAYILICPESMKRKVIIVHKMFVLLIMRLPLIRAWVQ